MKEKKCVGFWQVFLGVGFLVAAAAVVLSVLGVVTFGVNIGWGLLTVFLAVLAIASLVKWQWFGVFMPIAGILTILITKTDYLNFLGGEDIGLIWVAAALLSIGFSVLLHRRGFKIHHAKNGGFVGPDEKVIDQEDESEVRVDVSLGSTIKYVNSEDFKRAVLHCNLGSIKAYFDNAVIKGESATIEIYGSLCGLELYLPRDWNVVNNISSSLGGVEEHGPRSSDPKKAKTVYLTGNLTMSGVEITYI